MAGVATRRVAANLASGDSSRSADPSKSRSDPNGATPSSPSRTTLIALLALLLVVGVVIFQSMGSPVSNGPVVVREDELALERLIEESTTDTNADTSSLDDLDRKKKAAGAEKVAEIKVEEKNNERPKVEEQQKPVEQKNANPPAQKNANNNNNKDEGNNKDAAKKDNNNGKNAKGGSAVAIPDNENDAQRTKRLKQMFEKKAPVVEPLVIVFQGHSGSCQLVDLLDHHSHVIMVGMEPMGYTRWKGADRNKCQRWTDLFWNIKPGKTPAEWEAWKTEVVGINPKSKDDAAKFRKQWTDLEKSGFFDNPQAKVVVGFKSRISPLKMCMGNDMQTWSKKMRDKNMKLHYILVHRKNLIKWGLSHVREQTGKLSQWVGKNDPNHPRCEDGLLSAAPVNQNSLTSMARSMKSEMAQIDRFKEYGSPSKVAVYEHMLNDRAQYLAELHKFLGLKPESPPEGKDRFTKSTSDDLCRSILNFEEICKSLRNTEFYEMLSDASHSDCKCKVKPLVCDGKK